MKKILLIVMLFMAACSSAVVMEPTLHEKNAERDIERSKKTLISGDLEHALQYANSAIETALVYNLPAIRVKALLAKSAALYERGQLAAADTLLQEAENLASHEARSLMPYVLFSKAVLTREKGDAKKAKDIISSIGDIPSDLVPAVYNFKALGELSAGNAAAARDLASSALSAAGSLPNYYEKSMALKIIAQADMNEKQYDRVIKQVKESLEIDRKAGAIKNILWDLELLGNAYKALGDKDNAFYYYYQGYELSANVGAGTKRAFFLEKAQEILQ